jgi:hypothetical protein
MDRRGFFQTVSGGLHGAALAYLLGKDAAAQANDLPTDLRPRKPHFEAKAKSVIHLFMNGGPGSPR